MSQSTVVHDTLVIERRYPVPRAKVFQAWADVEQRRKWHFPDDAWVVVEMAQDFRVGGQERMQFGPAEDPNVLSLGHFLDIVPDLRIVSAGTMHVAGERISTTLCTVELSDDAAGTRVKLTDQSAFLDGRDSAAGRREGWGTVLDHLGALLAGRDPSARTA